jgi:phosphoglycerol transferase MdoB-like AlkP superfamily enzyme
VQLSLQLSDAMYFAESGRHVSYEMRDVLTDATGLFMTAVSKHALFIVLGYSLIIVVLFLAYKPAKKLLSIPLGGGRPVRYRGRHEVALICVVLLSIVFVRGGVTGIPQSVISAFKIGDARQAIIAMNGAYSVVYGALNSSKEIDRVNVKLPQNVDVDAIMRSLYPDAAAVIAAAAAAESQPATPVKKYNLIFILMEGWPADEMSAYGFEKPTTPFYASIKAKSFAPLGVISGGVRTTEGIYATFCSQQNPLGETVAQTSLQNNQYECLPAILKKRGWHTAFFQGTHKETSGTGAFAQSLGFSESFAKEDMPEGRYERNYWGAHDPDIYDFLLNRLDEMPQPFLVGVNTNSTHDVKMPAGVKQLFGNANRGEKHQSILHFADQSMQGFFEKIRDKPYFKNTIFVLMSDHTGGKHKTLAQRYFIPGVIYAEDLVAAKQLDRYASQRDFAPTVLELLGLPASPSFTGKSLFSENDATYFADFFDSGTIGWVEDKSLVETSVVDPSDMKCYSLENGLINAYSVNCDPAYKKSSLHSLVFTSYSQDLLFKGKTKSFYQFEDK